MYADAHPQWGTGYKWLDTNLDRDNATPDEQTFTETFKANTTNLINNKMTIHFTTLFNVAPTDSTEQALTIKNIVVQEVADARKTKMKAPLALDQDGLAVVDQAFENAKTALAATITGDAAQKKAARRDGLKSMFDNTSGLLKIKMTRTELGISSDKLKRENVVVVNAGETINVSAVNSADESFYCPLANDGDEITLTKGEGNSLTVKRQDAGGEEKHIITTASNILSITKGVTSYTTPAELGELVENDVITVTFTDGKTIIFFIGSVGDGSETESSGASGDPFLVTLL